MSSHVFQRLEHYAHASIYNNETTFATTRRVFWTLNVSKMHLVSILYSFANNISTVTASSLLDIRHIWLQGHWSKSWRSLKSWVQLVATTIFGQGVEVVSCCMPFSILGAKVLRYFRSRERKYQGTKVPWNESSRERKFQGTKVPWNESSRERKFHGTKVPGSESSRERKFHPWNFRPRERKYVGTKVPVTDLKTERKRKSECSRKTNSWLRYWASKVTELFLMWPFFWALISYCRDFIIWSRNVYLF